MKKFGLAGILAVVLAVVTAIFFSDEYLVTRIIDGDTIEVSGW